MFINTKTFSFPLLPRGVRHFVRYKHTSFSPSPTTITCNQLFNGEHGASWTEIRLYDKGDPHLYWCSANLPKDLHLAGPIRIRQASTKTRNAAFSILSF